jgi:hypothetical protein
MEDTYINLDSYEIDSVGSLAGSASNSLISNVYTTGNINVTGAACNIGGILGDANATTIIDSYNAVNVNFDNTHQIFGGGFVGGIVGNVSRNGAEFLNSFNTGNITITTDVGIAVAGGIAGVLHSYTSITNSFNSGNIMLPTNINSVAGGIFGRGGSHENGILVRNSYNVGLINDFDCGGIDGMSSPWNRIYTSYSRCRDELDFSDFDFADVWTIIPELNNGLPVLRVHEHWLRANMQPTHLVISEANPTANWLEITNPTGELQTARGLFLNSGDDTWRLPAIIVPAGETVTVRGQSNDNTLVHKRMTASFDFAVSDSVLLTNFSGNVLSTITP